MGWDTTLWPDCWKYYRYDKQLATDIYNAIKERSLIAGIPITDAFYPYNPPPLDPPNYRDLHATLIQYKKYVKEAFLQQHPRYIPTSDIIGYYVQMYNFILAPEYGKYEDYPLFENYPEGSYDWIQYSTDYPFTPVYITKDNIYGLCRLPDNYFSYTPYRALNGSGPFADDDNVGHMRGWETTETQSASLDTLPDGRSKWFTTDYGWVGLYSIINKLKITPSYTYKSRFTMNDRLGFASGDYTQIEQDAWNGYQTGFEGNVSQLFQKTTMRYRYPAGGDYDYYVQMNSLTGKYVLSTTATTNQNRKFVIIAMYNYAPCVQGDNDHWNGEPYNPMYVPPSYNELTNLNNYTYTSYAADFNVVKDLTVFEYNTQLNGCEHRVGATEFIDPPTFPGAPPEDKTNLAGWREGYYQDFVDWYDLDYKN